MKTLHHDRFPRFRFANKMGMGFRHKDGPLRPLRGDVHFTMIRNDGEVLLDTWKPNVITLDAGLLLARLCRNNLEPKHGINMLAVGTGALGAILSPDKATREQRRLNNEIARKPFVDVTFRDEQGAAVAIPTRFVDFSTIFGENEAVGPLNEMGLLSTISDNILIKNPNPNFAGQGGETYDPTVDVTKYDILVNALTFGVITKPANASLAITWRLSFG